MVDPPGLQCAFKKKKKLKIAMRKIQWKIMKLVNKT